MAACATDLMECSLCRGEFKDPRALPCLHTFCLNCLALLCDTNQYEDTMKWPMCKEEHGMPENGVQGFRKNFLMNSFMEVNKTEEVHVKPTMCKQHPSLELTHYCEDCHQVSCTQCITQKHQNHQIQPMKSLCEAKLGHLKLMAEAIELNHQLVQSAREKLEENKSQIHDILNSRVKDLHAQLDEEAKRNWNYIDKMISEAHDLLNVKEIDNQGSKVQQKLLEVRFNDTIPNIVEANADKHLDTDLSSLYEDLNNWGLKYSLLKVVDLDPFKNVKNWVIKMPEQSVNGVPVTLFKPVVPSVAPKTVTSRKRAASTLQKPRILVQSSPNSVQKKNKKARVLYPADVTVSDLISEPERKSDIDEEYVTRRPVRMKRRWVLPPFQELN